MSDTANASTLARMANQILNGKEYFTSLIYDKLNEAQEALPHDQAFSAARKVIARKIDREGSLSTISQKEFQDIHNQVCGLGNKVAFRELMGEFLFDSNPYKQASYNDDFINGIRNGTESLDMTDPNLVQELSGLFDDSAITANAYIDNGKKGLELELSTLGVSNPKVEVAAKNQHFVIYAGQLESTRGPVQVLIPAEIKNASVMLPSVFVAASKFADLNTENLATYAQGVATGSLKTVKAGKVLDILTSSLSEGKVSTADFDGIENSMNTPGLYMEELDAPSGVLDDQQPLLEMPNALVHLAQGDIQEALVEAGLEKYNRDTVVKAKSLVASELRSMGVQVKKVSVASEFDNGIMIAANIVGSGGNKTIETPVEVIDGQVLMPSVFTSGPLVASFDKDGISKVASGSQEGLFKAAFSDKRDWTYKQLHDHALTNAAYGNFVETEESLTVIAEVYGDQYHKAAFNDLTMILNASVATPVNEMEVKLQEMVARAEAQDNRIKMDSGTLMYLYPEASGR